MDNNGLFCNKICYRIIHHINKGDFKMISKKCTIEYEYISGSSKNNINLVFIHGSGCDKRFLRALAEQVKEYNCYLLDLPGHGGSDDTGYTAENYTNHINDFLKGMDNVILIGHSLGGTITLSVLAQNIPAIKSGVIISSTVSFSKLDKEFMKKMHAGIVDMNYIKECVGNITDSIAIETLNYMGPEKLIINDFLIDEVINVESCLKDINVPTTIMTGGDEILALVEYSEHLHENIQNSKLVVFPNERHMLPITQREKIGSILKDIAKSFDK